jgi:hypothetical protein
LHRIRISGCLASPFNIAMPALTTSLFAAAAAFSGFSAIYGIFYGKSKGDDKPGSGSSGSASAAQPRRPPPPPPTSHSRSQTTTRTSTSSSDHVHNHDSYYNWNHTVTSGTRAADSRPAPSASTHAQPSYQQPVYPRAAQATAQTKESLEFSDHIHRQTLPTSTTHSHVSSAQSTRSQADQVAYLHKLREQRAILSLYQASESRQTPSTSVARAQVLHPTQSTPSHVDKTTSSTSDHLDPWASLTPSHARVSHQTPSTTASPARAPLSTPSRVGKTTSTTSDHLDTLDSFDPWTRLASSPTRVSRQDSSASARTHASYLGQQTTPQIGGQSTLRTHTVADYDGSTRRSGLTSRNAEEPRVVHPDSPMMSPYSHLRPPSPDADRVSVSQLTASPKKHSRTQSSSSDSDHYLGPSSPSRAVPRSRAPLSDQLDPFDDAVANAESNRKARELREKARRSHREMRDARDRAKIARRMGDRAAESECNQAARAHESAMKNFNKNAAKIIFRVKNQVRVTICRGVQIPFMLTLPPVGVNLVSRGGNG